MKTVIVKFMVDDQKAPTLDLQLRHVLNEWPVLVWAHNEPTEGELAWYEREYGRKNGRHS